MRTTALTAIVLLFILLTAASGQKLPSSIRGYKLQNTELIVAQADSAAARDGSADIVVKLSDPVIAEMGLLSAVIEVGGEFRTDRYKGRIDFVSFHDVRINGIAVSVEEYTLGFSFDKQQWSTIQNPIRATISFTKAPQAFVDGSFVSDKELTVTGTVFAFGKFRKHGMSFKRVVPIRISLQIKNPLISFHKPE